jgi:hypothetical protein
MASYIIKRTRLFEAEREVIDYLHSNSNSGDYWHWDYEGAERYQSMEEASEWASIQRDSHTPSKDEVSRPVYSIVKL